MDWAAIASEVAREWGLPLAFLIGLGLLMLKKRGKRKRWDGEWVDTAAFLVPGTQLDEARDQLERQERDHLDDTKELKARQTLQLEYVEARRAEEREGRIAAERRVSDLTERWDRALSLLGGIEKELIRAGRDDGRRDRPGRVRDA